MLTMIKYLRGNKIWNKGEMARTIVIYNLLILTAVLIWAVVVSTIYPILHLEIDVNPVLTYTASTFGGELVLLAAKRIFAKKNEEVC